MKWLALILTVVFGAYLLTAFAVVGSGQRGVVRRFGRVVARPGPGLWVGLPWGFERVDRVAVGAARQVTVGADDPAGVVLLTGDDNLVAVRLVVEYAAGPGDADLDDYVLNRDLTADRLARHAETLAAEWAGARVVDRALLTGHAGLAEWVRERLPGRIAGDRLGVAVGRVSVESLTAPPEVREAFDAVTDAQTAARTAENQAEQAAAARLRVAATTKARLADQSAAYRAEQLASADAEAEAFRARLASYRGSGATSDALAALWWDEIGLFLAAMKVRGRVDALDHFLGPQGLDVTQFLTPTRPPEKLRAPE